MKDFIKINPKDNVAVAISDVSSGHALNLDCCKLYTTEVIKAGHKIALNDIDAGTPIIKYGSPIGVATRRIEKGSWVHTHNLKTALSGKLEYSYEPTDTELPMAPADTFMGYMRANGKAAVRNEIWIIPTVGCVNSVAAQIEKQSYANLIPGVDGVYSFPHPFGCSQTGDDHKTTQKLLAALVKHPNAAGVLVLGLGCENNNISEFKKVLGKYDSERVKFLNCQDSEDEILEGVEIIRGLISYASQKKRVPVKVSKLVVGLKCGGSDGFSGITGNPAVGAFSDILTSRGGTTILTEVPEMFGAETLLMNRAQDKSIFSKTVDMINGFKQYYIDHHQEIYENPSPGNKEGGITTLEEKSLGCTQKSGSSKIVDVLDYAQPVKTHGLNLLTSPGNDIVATTALVASGAHIVLFTTGRGNPLGGPVPTVKISTNTKLFRHKRNWIDFNTGGIIEGQPIQECGMDLYKYVLTIAEGTQTQTEKKGYREISIFKDGVTL